jgi:hypothetical protein
VSHKGPEALRAELLERIRAGTPLADEEFDRLARAVFAHQYACNEPYRRFCERQGESPETIPHWSAIPAVPTDAFKAAPLVCGGPSERHTVFRTSGTTQGSARRGEHHFPDLTLYDAALRGGFAAHLLPDGARPLLLALIAPAHTQPDSSLSHMTSAVLEEFGAPGSRGFVAAEGMDTAALERALRAAEASGTPVCLLGTSFAFVHWLDDLRASGRRFRLPPGSRIMDTGGFKGRSREVGREELYAGWKEQLGVGAAWCVNEYGMTEMSSQFYDAMAGRGATAGEPRSYLAAPWVRSRAVDPETLRSLAAGEVGVMRHWDLANLHSVAAIQTADLGVSSGDGFRLLGRASGAEARGCSLAMEELLAALGESLKGKRVRLGPG